MSLNHGYLYREQIDARGRGKTALAHLSDSYRHSSVEEWEERFGRGEVALDGKVTTSGALLRAGQELTWHRPPWEEPDVPRHFTLIHEDSALLVVDKPSGLPTLPSGGFLHNTLLHVVRERFPEACPLHRLGRATSGLVLFARNAAAAAELSLGFRERSIEKRYRALSTGVATQDRYDITAPIGLVPHPRLGEVHGANPKGKRSHSVASVVSRRAGQTLFEVDLHTGRPEQIRIHLAFVGHPLAGDPLYAEGGLPRADHPGLPGDGGYLLHAGWLAFAHPLTGDTLRLHAPLPAALEG